MYNDHTLQRVRIIAVDLKSRDVAWSIDPFAKILDPTAGTFQSNHSLIKLLNVEQSTDGIIVRLLASDSIVSKLVTLEVNSHSKGIKIKIVNLNDYIPNIQVVSISAFKKSHSHESIYMLLLSNYKTIVVGYHGVLDMESKEYQDYYMHIWGTGIETDKKCTSEIEYTNGNLYTLNIQPSTCINHTPLIIECNTQIVSTTYFDPDKEAVYSIIESHKEETVHSRATILGDDSVLLKSLNPNILLITSLSPAGAVEDYADMTYISEVNERKSLELIQTFLYITLIDAISGRILYRNQVDSATGPIHGEIIENQVFITYWNTLAKRTELLSLALYEGMVDKYSLVPGANKPAINKANINSDGTRNVSSFSLIPPVVQSKVYILPKGITGIVYVYISDMNIM